MLPDGLRSAAFMIYSGVFLVEDLLVDVADFLGHEFVSEDFLAVLAAGLAELVAELGG
ncbi:MAG: hypothetical protein RLZZ458_1035 [Planctomycetota bacterium]